MTPSSARRAVDAYVEAVNARDLDTMAALFAPDAVLYPPESEALHGRDAVAAYYRDLVFAVGPSVQAVNHVAEGDTCVVELEATVGSDVLRFADVFTVDLSGLVGRLAIYRR